MVNIAGLIERLTIGAGWAWLTLLAIHVRTSGGPN